MLRGTEVTWGLRECAGVWREPKSGLWPNAPALWQKQAALGAPVKGG